MSTKSGKLYQRFAEIGRVVLIQYGPEAGKLATIIDILDHNRVINFKWLALTDLKINAYYDAEKKKVMRASLRNARQATLEKVWKAADILNKWNASSWGKKIASKTVKANESDFDRFKVKLAKQRVSALVKQKMRA